MESKIKKTGVILIFLAGLFGFFNPPILLASPGLINFQSMVTDSGGTLITDTSATIIVKIYDLDTGGTLLWEETHTSVNIQNGVYNIILGSLQAFPSDLFSGDVRWFELMINGETLTPRQQMTSVAFALKADHAASADLASSVINNSITTTMINDTAVSTTKIADSAVTQSKIADGSVTSAKIVDGPGSGLNADMLDNLDSSNFASSTHNHNGLYYDKAYVNSLEARIAALEDLLQHFARNGSDITISGANLHIVNGNGATSSAVNSTGNLVIGYNELRGTGDIRTGSHNLVVGSELNFSSYGGLVVGLRNSISGAYASVSGGKENTAGASYASVSGGTKNTASGGTSFIAGGYSNTASGFFSSIIGGWLNKADGYNASIFGGYQNHAGYDIPNFIDGNFSVISGGKGNRTGGNYSSISGGNLNTTDGDYASVSGGLSNTANSDLSSISGGSFNNTYGTYSSISGGQYNDTVADHSAILGGQSNLTGDSDYISYTLGMHATIAGGSYNVSSGDASSVSGGSFNEASELSSSVSGGLLNLSSGWYSSVSGGELNTAGGEQSSVSGGKKRSAPNPWDWDAGSLYEVVCIDSDGDGYGISGHSSCPSQSLSDCDDSDSLVNPGVTEGPAGDATCSDSLDNNCNGLTDGIDPGC